MKKKYFIGLAMITAMGLVSCEYRDIEPDGPAVVKDMSFAADIKPIFQTRGCTNCHDGSPKPNLSGGDIYNNLMTGGYVDTVNVTESKIYGVPKPGRSHSANYTAQQAQFVLAWIEQGAKNN